jgi:phage recombination protein Bet
MKASQDNSRVEPTTLIERAVARSGMSYESFVTVLTQTAFSGLVAWTQADLERLLAAAERYELNPLNREIFAMSARASNFDHTSEHLNEPILLVVGVDGWCKILNTHPAFDGVTFCESNSDDLTSNLAPAWMSCSIHRKDRSMPITVTEYFHEVRTDHIAWATHPRRMLRHKALVQCARVAFGLTGIVDPDEARRIQESKLTSAKQPRRKARAMSSWELKGKLRGKLCQEPYTKT